MDDPRTDPSPADPPPPVLRFASTMRPAAEPSAAPEADIRHAGRLSEIETQIEKLAERFDRLEFVIVEQFEPGMTPVGDLPHGNLRDRLDRIEAAIGLLSRLDEDRRTELRVSTEEALVGVASSQAVGAEGQGSGVIDARIGSMLQSLDAFSVEARSRHDDLLAAFERAMRRPLPAPDLSQQHRSFAGFATALQVALDRLDGTVGCILDALHGVTKRLEALEARPAPVEPPVAAAAPATADLGDALHMLGDKVGALTGVLAAMAEQKDPADIGALSMRLDALGAVLSAGFEDAAHGNRVAIEDTLRDLRLAVAEIAAENRRLRIA